VAEFVGECGEIDLGYAHSVAGDGGFDVEVHFCGQEPKLRFVGGVNVEGDVGSECSRFRKADVFR
jgi:hypothetical protein